MRLRRADAVCRRTLWCDWMRYHQRRQCHHAVASQRAQMASLSDRVEFVCGDYSIVGGEFDKIVSVGMLEHAPRL